MRIIYTHRFPSGDFHGINLFGTVFVQRRWGKFLPYEVNHEMIHSYQQWELTYLVFYTLYVLEFLVRLVQCRWNTDRAYRSISFEREAFAHERDFQYLRHRRPFAWLRFWVDKG
jgi:hypothetical protein